MIKVENVSMKFRMSDENVTSLKEFTINAIRGKNTHKDFWVFKNISFEVKKGEVIGIIGRNGAGKSTLLKIISGILTPTEGSVKLNGRIVPMLELGSGFDFELTGRENIFLNGAILGYSEDFLKEKYEEIVEFSELGEFIETPIRNYSSGMMMRLAFAIATVVKPEILICDEILAVGDEAFQKKSKRKMLELMGGGTTVLFVSHSIDQIREMCNRVIWIEKGSLKMQGETKFVCDEYQKYINPNEFTKTKRKNSDADKNLSDVLFVYGDCDNAYDWRVTNLREQLVAAMIPSNEIYEDDLTDIIAKLYRVFIFVNCNPSFKIEKLLIKAKEYNKTVLFDLNSCEYKLNKDTVEQQKSFIDSYKIYCDGVIASNEYLANIYKYDSLNVYINSLSINEKMRQLAQWVVYDRDVLPYKNSEHLNENELINYNKAVAAKKDKEARNFTIGLLDGCFDDEFIHSKVSLVLLSLMKKYNDIYIVFEGINDKNQIPVEYLDYIDRIICKAKTDSESTLRNISNVDVVVSSCRCMQEIDNVVEKKISCDLVKVPIIIMADEQCVENRYVDLDFCINEEECIEKVEYLMQLKKDDLIENCEENDFNKNDQTIEMADDFARSIRTEMKKNIAFLVSDRAMWGCGNLALYHAITMRKHGYDVEMIVTGKNQDNILYKNFDLPTISRDIVYSYQKFDFAVATDSQSAKWMDEYNIIEKRFYIVQGIESCYFNEPIRRLESNQIFSPRHNTYFLTPSNYCKTWMENKYKIDAKILPYHFQITEGQKEGSKSNKITQKKVILAASNPYAESSNIEDILLLFDAVEDNKYEKWLYTYDYEYNKSNKYKLFNYLTNDEVEKMFANADILIIASVFEFFHSGILELIKEDTIIIAAKNIANEEMLKNRNGCIFYESGMLKNAVSQLEKTCKEITEHANHKMNNISGSVTDNDVHFEDEEVIVSIYE